MVLCINLIMDGFPAQSLGVERVAPDVMRRRPRSPKQPVVSAPMIGTMLFTATAVLAVTVLVFISELSDGQVTRRDTTMTFVAFVTCDLVLALSCRSTTKSIFELGMFSNTFFLVAIGGSVIGQILIVYL